MTKLKFEYTPEELDSIRKVKNDIKKYINTLVFYMNYEASKKGLVSLAGTVSTHGVLAGGAIASILQHQIPRDLDIYLPISVSSEFVHRHDIIVSDKTEYVTGLHVSEILNNLSNNKLPDGIDFIATDYTISAFVFNTAIKGLTDILPLKEDIKVQFIFTKRPPKEYINGQFPYIHQLGQYTPQGDTLSFSPKTYVAIQRKLLSPNPNANSAIQNKATNGAADSKYVKEYNYYFIDEDEMEQVMRDEIQTRRRENNLMSEFLQEKMNEIAQDIADSIRYGYNG